MIEVELPDGSIAEYPDETPKDVIEKSIRQKFAPIPPPQSPGLAESIKALPRTALNVATGIASFPFMAPQWAVGMQEKYSGQPYEGLLTTPIGDKTFAQLAEGLGTAIQSIGQPQTEAERRQVNLINLPFEGLAKGGELLGNVENQLSGNPSSATLTEALINLAPMFFGRGQGREIIPNVTEGLTDRMYRSALKPEKKFSLVDQLSMIKQGKETWTLVKEGIGGLDKIRDKIEQSTATIDKTIDKASKTGEGISKEPLLKELYDIREKWPTWAADETFQKMIADIEGRPDTIPMAEAQKLKRQLNHAYDRQSTALLNEGERALRRSILDGEIKLHPELRQIGQNEKSMINLQNAIESRIKTFSRRELLGIGALIKGGLGIEAFSKFGHGPEIAMATLASLVMDHPTVKSAIAIALNEVGKIGPKMILPIPPRVSPQNPYQNMAEELLGNVPRTGGF